MLDEESGKLGLRDHRELRVRASDIPFPVRVLRGVGCCGKQTWMWLDAHRHMEQQMSETFGSWGGILFGTRTRRRLSVQGW